MTPEQNADLVKSGELRTLRLIRPSVVVLCGPAACGKSAFAERHFRPTQIISSDWARGRVSDDERDQRFQAQAFALVHFLIEQRLGLNRLCVVDSTALSNQSRKELMELARKYQVPCVAFVFEVPLEKCVERDQGRERTVGRPVIERQYQAFEQAKASIRQEGFDQIVELREGDLENIRIEVVFRPVARPVLPQRSGQKDRRPGSRPTPLGSGAPTMRSAVPPGNAGNATLTSTSGGGTARPVSPAPAPASSPRPSVAVPQTGANPQAKPVVPTTSPNSSPQAGENSAHSSPSSLRRQGTGAPSSPDPPSNK